MTDIRSAAAPTRRPGGRAAAVVAAVHRAATDLLAEIGYDAMQLPEVAARAGVNKTTVYRRWPTKPELVSDLLLELTGHGLPERDTGNLLDDLVALLADVAALVRTPLAQALLSASLAGQLNDGARRAFWEQRMQRSAVIVERAVRRGELPPDTDPRGLLELAASPIYFRLLITGEQVGRPDLRRFAQRAIRAATTA